MTKQNLKDMCVGKTHLIDGTLYISTEYIIEDDFIITNTTGDELQSTGVVERVIPNEDGPTQCKVVFTGHDVCEERVYLEEELIALINIHPDSLATFQNLSFTDDEIKYNLDRNGLAIEVSK